MKNTRQKKILELIIKYEISTQEELLEKLRESGCDVTQATVSRDIREMKLTKIETNGRLRYVAYKESDGDLNEKYRKVLREGFLSMDNAMNILVIKTISGMAMAVAAALDSMEYNEIVGCIAGDDTVMCAVRSVSDTVSLMDKLRKIIDR
ncbi:MAG: arginine repressor [Lachnospiraceae bacterium]|nr:arginine repressor [Lachnospiraceae bacterium]